MSEDTGSATHSDSESTIEAMDVDAVIQVLQQAAEDAIELQDWLLYSTVVDYYLGDREKHTAKEQEQLLECVVASLASHKELVYNVGWDIPALLVAYIDQDREEPSPLRTLPCLPQVMKGFEVLALQGNHKELLLKGCELMTSVKIEDNFRVGEGAQKEYYQIKMHCLIELVSTSLWHIQTLYPSRFLTMAVTAFFNVIDYSKHDAAIRSFMMKRAYSFARDYAAPTVDLVPDLSPKELAKIKDDETYLQRKLLRGFVTQSFRILASCFSFDMSGDYAAYLASGSTTEDWFQVHLRYPAFSRTAELVLAFDVDLHAKMAEYVAASHALLDRATVEPAADQDEATAVIFQAVLSDYESTISSSMLDSSGEKLQDSMDGCLLLYSFLQCSRNTCDEINIDFSDALVSTIRLTVPGMLNRNYINFGLQDMHVFWMWVALHKQPPQLLHKEVSDVLTTLLKVYYQCLLFTALTQWANSSVRSATLTLFAKLMAHTDETVAWDFIHDTLANFPQETVKGAVIGVLKELLTKDRVVDLDLEKVGLGEKKEGKESTSKVKQDVVQQKQKVDSSQYAHRYIKLTDLRTQSLLQLTENAVDNTIMDGRLNQETFGTLVAYLNLVVATKRQLQEAAGFENFVAKIQEKVERAEKEMGDDSRAGGLTERNALGILRVCVDRLE